MFKEELGNKLLIFDGALGTLIQNEVPGIKILDELNITKPELMKKIHNTYIQAGSDVITTNTFGANSFKLQGSPYTVEEIIEQGVKNVKDIISHQYIALDVGPLGKMMEPLGDLTFDAAYKQFKRQVVVGEKSGCDLILIETMTNLLEAKIAVLAAKENTSLPVICSMTFNENGKTMYGTDPMTMVAVMEGLGVDAVGINCSYGPDKLMPMVKQMLQVASIPVIVQPNAGLPIIREETVSYDITKEQFGSAMKEMVASGVLLVGGCCGTTPEYIRYCKKILSQIPLKKIIPQSRTIATSAKTTVIFDGITVVGEALVPTGRKKYTEALLQNNNMFFLRSAKDQKKRGAQIININVSTPGVDEKNAMIEGIKKISNNVDCPLQIDSVHSDIIEAGLRYYPGKGIINSVNGKEACMQSIFPIAKKYGACVIGMTFDEKGIPHGVNERVAIAQKIIKRANDYGISKKNIIIDCLSLTAQVYQEDLMDTLEVVKRVKALGVKSMLGIANVSYALPCRSILDRTYFAMALAQGLDVVMLSVYDNEMIDTLYAYQVLANIDTGALSYKEKYAPKQHLKDSINQLKNDSNKSRIILAAVKGDAINTGLNIFGKALKEEGYWVNNLGLNVSKELILDQAIHDKCNVIGLSVFSPYALNSLKETVEYIKKNASNIKIIIGGASMQEEVAQQMGVQYAKNVSQAVKLLEALDS